MQQAVSVCVWTPCVCVDTMCVLIFIICVQLFVILHCIDFEHTL